LATSVLIFQKVGSLGYKKKCFRKVKVIRYRMSGRRRIRKRKRYYENQRRTPRGGGLNQIGTPEKENTNCMGTCMEARGSHGAGRHVDSFTSKRECESTEETRDRKKTAIGGGEMRLRARKVACATAWSYPGGEGA